MTTFEALIERALDTAGDRPVCRSGGPAPGVSGKELDAKLLADAARARGMRVLHLPDTMQVLDDGHRRVGFFQAMAWTVTALERFATNSKKLTKRALAARGLPIAAGDVVGTPEEAHALARDLGFPVVVKPVKGFGGRGVTVGVRTEDELDAAWEAATAVAGRVLVEECVVSIDLRIMVAGGRAVAAVLRVPAHVVGDGVSTITELVEAKNAVRATNPYLHGSPLRLPFPGPGPGDVPPAGRRVFLHYKANVGAGGESHDVTGLVRPSRARLAEQAAACFPGAGHAGIDLLVERLDAGVDEQRAVVCEVNLNNDLPMHAYPLYGEPVDVAARMLDAYFPGERHAPGVRGPRASGEAAVVREAAAADPAGEAAETSPREADAGEAENELENQATGTSSREADARALRRELRRLGFGSVRFRERLLFLQRDGTRFVSERSGTSIFAARLSRRPEARSALLAGTGIPVAEPAYGSLTCDVLLIGGHPEAAVVHRPGAEPAGFAQCPIPGLAGTAGSVWRLCGSPPVLSVTFAAFPGTLAATRAEAAEYAVTAIASDPALAPFASPRAGTAVDVYPAVARVIAAAAIPVARRAASSRDHELRDALGA